MRQFGLLIVNSRKYASLFILLFAFLPFFGLPTNWLSLVIVALVTLRHGAKEGALMLAWAALPAVALAALYHPLLLMSLVLIHGIFVWGFALLLRRRHSWSLILEISALLGIIAVLALHLVYPHIGAWWQVQLKTYMQHAFTHRLDLTAGAINQFAARVASYASGFIIAFVITMNLLSLLIARWWESRLFKNKYFREECYSIRMSQTASIGLVIFLAATLLFRVAPMLDAIPVVIMPLLIAALSMFHALTVQKHWRKGKLAILYGSLILFSPYVAIALAGLGFADSWCNFRVRLAKSNVS